MMSLLDYFSSPQLFSSRSLLKNLRQTAAEGKKGEEKKMKEKKGEKSMVE